MARDCHSKNKVPRRQFNMTQRRSEEKELERDEPQETKDEPAHKTLSWTACYDDACLIHYDAKMGAAWFPSAPKKKGRRQATREINVITRKDDLEEGEVEKDDVESDPEEDDSDSEESEEESSDDDQPEHLCDFSDNIEVLHAYVPTCFAMMFGMIMKHGEEAFPTINS